MIKAIFFDFDGVVVESVDIKTKAFIKLFEREGNDVIKKVVKYHLKNTGISRYEKFRYIYKKILNRTLDDKEFNILCSKFANLVVDGVLKAPYVKGAKEFLENYASEYKCFVTSATPQVELEEIILKRYMSHFFKSIYGAPTKKSDAVRNILMSEKIDNNVAVYIGDALSDYKAAKDNYVHFISRINNNENMFATIDCPKVKDLTNLKAILDSM